MDPIVIFIMVCVLGTIWTAIWAWVVVSARHPIPYPQIESRASVLRRRLNYVACAVVLAVFLASIYWFPYRFVRGTTLGTPVVKVKVLAQQWAWNFSQDKFQTGVPIEFDVTASDVNHGFGLYDPEGSLIAQVQAMPGYVNHLIVMFDKAGTYTVRCLELCGTPHFLMESQLTVTR